jgi:hypothetical protein
VTVTFHNCFQRIIIGYETKLEKTKKQISSGICMTIKAQKTDRAGIEEYFMFFDTENVH